MGRGRGVNQINYTSHHTTTTNWEWKYFLVQTAGLRHQTTLHTIQRQSSMKTHRVKGNMIFYM